MSRSPFKVIRFGHSPDPDDAFMFYAFAEEKIPMHGFRVEHVIEDIESLNQRALAGGELEVTAVSCHAYAYLADTYAPLRSGASLGEQYGPILVSCPGRTDAAAGPPQIRGKKIAVPGKLTTAYLVLRLYEKEFEPVFVPFDRILNVVRQGETDFGLVIHEGQLTYAEEGLEKVLDLGRWWHGRTGLPLPLGVDVIRRDLGEATMKAFASLFRTSIEYALQNRKPALDYAIQYGRGISAQDNDRFVGMYVNDMTVDMGARGQAGFQRLLNEAYQAGLIPRPVKVNLVG